MTEMVYIIKVLYVGISHAVCLLLTLKKIH